ncbi:MazG-like family protein [Micromonospora wenchangensis]|uniref:MazG-like family protein n=1 Tax=Micromonospora wenchangensis TaxID=1185415 RepID=UPI0037F772F7
MSSFEDLCGDPWQDHYFEGPNHPQANLWLDQIHADQRKEATMTDTSMFDIVRRVTAQLNTINGTGREEVGLRILKVTEEAGEAASAWIGTIGQNPRKGVTHTRDDVAAELADVVLTALVAIGSLGLDPEQVVGDCITKVAARFPADTPVCVAAGNSAAEANHRDSR